MIIIYYCIDQWGILQNTQIATCTLFSGLFSCLTSHSLISVSPLEFKSGHKSFYFFSISCYCHQLCQHASQGAIVWLPGVFPCSVFPVQISELSWSLWCSSLTPSPSFFADTHRSGEWPPRWGWSLYLNPAGGIQHTLQTGTFSRPLTKTITGKHENIMPDRCNKSVNQKDHSAFSVKFI